MLPTGTVAEWVTAGRDVVRFALGITAEGLWSHPNNQIIQEHAGMDVLRRAWGEALGVSGTEQVQVIVRGGRGAAPYLSWRRGVEATLARGGGARGLATTPATTP